MYYFSFFFFVPIRQYKFINIFGKFNTNLIKRIIHLIMNIYVNICTLFIFFHFLPKYLLIDDFGIISLLLFVIFAIF